MHAIPFAAPPSEGSATAGLPAADAPHAAVRICVDATRTPDAAALALLRARLPRHAAIALIGGSTAIDWPDAERLPGIGDDRNPIEIAIAAARRFPGEHLIVVQADARLPEFACERLLRALQGSDVLGAVSLDSGRRSPLASPQSGSEVDAEHLDALCFAYSDRQLVDDPYFFSNAPAWFSAWHGERLAKLGPEHLRERDAVDAAGLRIVLLDHLYVESEPATAPVSQNGLEQHDSDPPSPLVLLRQRIGAALPCDFVPPRAGLDGKPVLLHVLHGWGGGAERWVRDFAGADTHAHHLVLIARGSFSRRLHGEWLELHEGTLHAPPLRRWPLPRPIADTALGDATYRDLLSGILRDYCVDAILISSLIGHSLDALRCALPLYWIVHDHYPLWPVLHRDFGDPALAFDDVQRAADIAANQGDAEFSNRDPQHWRRLRDATVVALSAAQATLIAPSRSALQNQLRLAPPWRDLAAQVIEHGLAAWPVDAPQPATPPVRDRLRLLVPGRVRRSKGAQLLAAILPRLREHAEIFLLGAGSDAHALFGQSSVHIVLDYRRDDLPRLLAQIRPDAALLLPTVAETFSFTLSEMRSLDVAVIATRVGALVERIEDGVDGFLVDPDADAVMTLIQQLAAAREPLAQMRQTLAQRRSSTTLQMARAYTRVLDLADRAIARYPLASIDGVTLENAIAVAALAAMRERERSVRADLDATRAESDRRGDWGHELDRALEERTRWARTLDEELRDIRPRHDQMLASTSWRITAPLRRTNARLQGVRASLAFRTLHLRNLIGRARGSLAQRGVAGTLRRIMDELRGRQPARARVAYSEPKEDFAPFALPSSATPRVSIVIPVYNKIAYTSACLRSLAGHAGAIPFEVIVVDDASSDATARRLADVAGIRNLRNAQNLGFIGSCNAGAAIARGDYVLFLNNDTVVTAGWLEALVRCIEEAPRAGMVGARLVYPDGRLQEAGGVVFNDASGWNYGRFEDTADSRYAFRREVDYCSGAAILLRRELFVRLGAFDTRYMPAYYEDTDLAFGVRANGLKVYYEPASTVVHFEGVTSGTDLASGTKRYQVINRDKFLEKWKTALVQQPAPGTPINIAATHRAGKRVLIVDATTPTPDQDSGSLRMVNLMRVLTDLGCQTSFLPDNRVWVERYTTALQEMGVEALYSPYAGNPVSLLRERGREFDLIILSRHYVAASYVGLVRLYAPQATLAFDTVDLHYLREQRAAELCGKADVARRAEATRTQELKLIRECDVSLVVSPVEQELLSRDAPGARVEVLSNVHEVYGCRRPFDQRRDLVFVGGFQHPPNTDAVIWFVHEVLPLIRAALPELVFHVIGSKVPDAVRALADEHVHVHGYVEDITPYMDGCRISVAPLRYGAGVKGKVNMAMSYGLPVVATTMAVEGMHVRSGEDVLVADAAVAFAAEVVRLHGDEALWQRLSANGLANVERHFSFAAAREAVQKLFLR